MKLNLLKKISKALGLTEEVRVENEGVLEDIVTLVDKIKEEHNYINSNEKYTDISLIFELPDGNRIFPRKINRMEDISPGCITPNYYPDISDRVLLKYKKYDLVKYDYRNSEFDKKSEIERKTKRYSLSYKKIE